MAMLPLASFTSCADMLETESDLVEFEEDNRISAPKDSLYSVMGIIRQMQKIADRNVLLGEVRADLMTPTDKVTTAIKQMAAQQMDADNPYNRIADYYAIINNCNNYIAKADTALVKYGKRVFIKEYAVVKTYRAWTYLQTAKIYGNVPLVTEPIYTEEQATKEMLKGNTSLADICNYFIDDIKPYVDTEQPQYGAIGGVDSRRFFIPVRLMLGELCLWAGRYQEAAEYFYHYLAQKNHPVFTGTYGVRWPETTEYAGVSPNTSNYFYLTGALSDEDVICGLRMESTEFEGVKGYIENVFNSNGEQNYDYFQITPSEAIRALSKAQNYCQVIKNSDTKIDTLYAPKENLSRDYYYGDLRLASTYSYSHWVQNETSHYSADRQTIGKIDEESFVFYRKQYVYLMLAEALNRAGYPEAAFCLLKYGLRNRMIEKYVSLKEREKAGTLLLWDDIIFTENNTSGIHDNGSGRTECDTLYVLPAPETELASYEDSVVWMIPQVEQMICDEMALETAFEGRRFYDLMRISMHRNDPAFLAEPISKRDGVKNEEVYSRMLDMNNWYLPKE